MFFSGQGGDQHDKGGLREVEVGNQAVYDLEPVTGIDENIGPAASRLSDAVLCGGGLQRTEARSSDGNDLPAFFLCLIDESGLILLHHIELRVHMVLGHILHLYGAESSKTHMKSDMSDIDALGPDLLQKLRREMKACCGSSRGAVMLCINGLVTVLVLQLMGDIGRQGIWPSLSRISSKMPS